MYLFEAFYTYVDFLYLFGYSWPPKYKSVHWLVFEWQWFHNPLLKLTFTTYFYRQLCLFVENIEPCASCSALFQVNSFYNCYKMLGYDIFIDEKLRPHLIGVLNCMSWCWTNFDEDELLRIWRFLFLGGSVLFQLLYLGAHAKLLKM